MGPFHPISSKNHRKTLKNARINLTLPKILKENTSRKRVNRPFSRAPSETRINPHYGPEVDRNTSDAHKQPAEAVVNA